MTRRTRSWARRMGLLAGAVIAAWTTPVQGATVTTYFRFLSFSGAVGSDGQFETFVDGVSVCPDAGCGTGIGVANIALPGGPGVSFYNTSFGVSALENEIYLTSNPDQDVTLGVPFLAGWLSYTNGIWFTDPVFEIDAVTQSLDDPAFDGFVFEDVLQLSITPNTGTPHQNADFLHLVNSPFAGSVRAFELADSPTGGNSVTAELWMTINSLHLDGFRNGTGDGFLDPSIELAPTVPEPGTVACVGIGLALLGGSRRRRHLLRSRGSAAGRRLSRAGCGSSAPGRSGPRP
jgi:hypothetical protein